VYLLKTTTTIGNVINSFVVVFPFESHKELYRSVVNHPLHLQNLEDQDG